jgi:hypothetical protein
VEQALGIQNVAANFVTVDKNKRINFLKEKLSGNDNNNESNDGNRRYDMQGTTKKKCKY